MPTGIFVHKSTQGFQTGHKKNVGRKHTAKTKTKIGIACSVSLKGRKLSSEHKRKIGVGNKGKKFSLEQRRNMSSAKRGEKSYLWRGGKTPLIKHLRKIFEYKLWRTRVFERDNYTCQICKTRGGNLEADHYPITFAEMVRSLGITTVNEAISCQEIWDVSKGRTLCVSCHRNTPTYGNKLIHKKGVEGERKKRYNIVRGVV